MKTMKTQELANMTVEQKRFAIMEAAGWRLEWQGMFAKTDATKELLHLLRPDGTVEISGFHSRDSFSSLKTQAANYGPDYLGDLNAMAEVEAMFAGSIEWQRAYRDELTRMVGCAWYQSAKLIFATAKMRAYAFLLALPAGPRAEGGGD